jgi:hypothetical protein
LGFAAALPFVSPLHTCIIARDVAANGALTHEFQTLHSISLHCFSCPELHQAAESTTASSSHMLAGNSISRKSDAAPALASVLSNLTALRILDISGAFSPVMFNSSPHPHPGNNIVANPYKYLEDDKVAAAVQPFALSLARLRDLESLNVSGVRATAAKDIDDCSCLVRCSRAALAPQSQIRMRCFIVTI